MFTKKFLKTKDAVDVTFQVDRPDLGSVEWLGETNGWDPVPMKRAEGGKGPFKLKMRLPKGTAVQFRYRFDGDWENDEAADDYWPNEHGSDNSVVLTDA
jgi:1,4-alpha-glucan branching enzyme